MSQQKLLIAGGLLWLTIVGFGLAILWRHESTPGLAATPPESWPVESQLPRAPDRATLILIAHPHCPCTRASIGELALLMARCQGRVAAQVLFVRPPGVADEWTQTDVWRSATEIPGVMVREDHNGIEAQRFQAETSGQALLYNMDGRLIFSGGITGSRGHSGDNEGRRAIVSLLTAGVAEHDRSLVFGCSLFDRECRDQKEEGH